MRFLRIGDYAVILAYFAILIGIGAAFRRKAAASVEDYFLAGRKMPWWALGLSQMTFWFDMTGTMIIASFLFLLGPRGIWIELRGGAGLVLVFLMLWAGKWHRRSGVITGAEWMIFRFGRDRWGHFARLMSVVSNVVINLALLAYSFKGAGLFLSMFLPFSPLVCSLIMMLVTALYTIESGFYGVIFSDIFQSVCIWIGVVLIVIIAVGRLAGVPDLGALAVSVTGNPDWLSALPRVKTPMPAGYGQYSFLLMMSLFYLGKTLIQGLGVGADPRFFGARSDRDCGRLSFLAGWSFMLRWPLMMSFVVLGLLLVKDLFPDQTVLAQAADLIKTHAGAVPQNEWPELLARVANHPQAFPAGAHRRPRPAPRPGLGLEAEPAELPRDRRPGAHPAGRPAHEHPGRPARPPPRRLPGGGHVDVQRHRQRHDGFPDPGPLPGLPPAQGRHQGAHLRQLRLRGPGHAHRVRDGLLHEEHQRHLGLADDGPCRRDHDADRAPALLVALQRQRLRVGDPDRARRRRCCSGPSSPSCRNGSRSSTWSGPASPGASRPRTSVPRPTGPSSSTSTGRRSPSGCGGRSKKILGPEEAAAAMAREHKYDLISLPFALFWQMSMLLLPLLLIVRQYRASAVTAAVLAAALVGLYFFWYRKLPE